MEARAPEGDAGDRIVIDVADAVRKSLLKLGLGEADSLEVCRRIAAEAARWSRDGQGTIVRQRTWGKT